jgi:hypothetical protein
MMYHPSLVALPLGISSMQHNFFILVKGIEIIIINGAVGRGGRRSANGRNGLPAGKLDKDDLR